MSDVIGPSASSLNDNYHTSLVHAADCDDDDDDDDPVEVIYSLLTMLLGRVSPTPVKSPVY